MQMHAHCMDVDTFGCNVCMRMRTRNDGTDANDHTVAHREDRRAGRAGRRGALLWHAMVRCGIALGFRGGGTLG